MQHINNTNYPNQVIHGAYYPHIDGIRAFAVLPVVLFHVLAALCPGGYAGVDVFFVISGYLITGGILRDLAKDRFTIRDFYYRRIRRILPAYFAVVAGVFVFGCAVYHLQPLMRLADATIMGSLFVANQYLWNVSGDYFSPDVHTNPLLHLWSLSVEEQFYLFIPVLCLGVWKFRRHWLMPMLAVLAVLSFGWAVYAMAFGKQVMAFYVLPLRAWELLAGSLLAMLPAVKIAQPSTAAADESSGMVANCGGRTILRPPPALLAVVGLSLVLVPYVLYSQTTLFPGTAALPSVVGTVLLIRYGGSGWLAGLLAWRPLVVVGKMSYSLYLWHWPVTVYWKYMVYDQLYAGDYVGMLLLSFLLAFLSWRFVEIPVRISPAWTLRRSFAFAAAGIVLLVGFGVACVFNNGWPTVLHPNANEILAENGIKSQFVESLLRTKIKRIKRAFGYKITDERKDSATFTVGDAAKPVFLLIGDSHASVLRPGLDIVLQGQPQGGLVSIYSGKAVFILESNECQAVLGELDKCPQISAVVLCQYWNRYMGDRTNYTRLAAFADKIKEKGKTLFIVGDIPDFTIAPVERMARERIIGSRRLPPGDYTRQLEKEYEQRQGDNNRRVEMICRKTGAHFIPLYAALKEGDGYITMVEENGKAVSLYSDNNHLSPRGALRAAQFLMPYLFPTTGCSSTIPRN